MTKLQQKKIPKFQAGKNIGDLGQYSFNLYDFSLPKTLQPKFSTFPDEYDEELGTKQIAFPEKQRYNWDEMTTSLEDSDEYASKVGTKYKTQKDTGFNVAQLIRPATYAASAAANIALLKKTRDAALDIKAPRVEAAQVANRPIEALPPEMIALQLKQLGNLQIKKTSDATANINAQQILNLSKMDTLEKLSEQQIKNLFGERARHDKTAAANVLANIEAINKRAELSTLIANKKAGIRAKYQATRQDFFNKFVGQLVTGREKAIGYNLGKEVIENEQAWNRLETQIVHKENQITIEPMNQKLKTELKTLLAQQSLLGNQTLPSHSETTKYMFSKRNNT